eukprot:scaffold428_cov168-Ochromonas_danica.AAC.28
MNLSNEDKEALTGAITTVLVNRQSALQTFARSKLEQVLAVICVNMLSLQPVLSLLVSVESPQAYAGLSAIRTVLDLMLSDDPKIEFQRGQTIKNIAQTILAPLITLSCQGCSKAVQELNEENLQLLTVCLEVLKIVIAKLPLGGHVTPDVLNMLFSLAECGSDEKSPYHNSALTSIEILTEIMYKKYIPNVSATADGQNSPTATKIDQGATILMHLVMKVVSLLKGYCEHGNMEDSPLVLALLEFIAVFSESHLERCMKVSFASKGVALPGSQNASGENGLSMQQNMFFFLSELVALTTVSMDPRVLHKVITVWNRVIAIDSVKEVVFTQQHVCVPIVSHLLQACLVASNPHHQENVDEMVDDLRLDILVDPHIKELLSKIAPPSHHSHSGNNGEGNVLSAEETSYVGSALIADSIDFFAEFIESVDVRSWLQQTVSNLLVQNINVLLSTSSSSGDGSHAALDLCVLMRIVPMTTTNRAELVLQLLNFVQQLCHMKCRPGSDQCSRELVVLIVTCCQIVGQLLEGNIMSINNLNDTLPSQGSADWFSIIDPLFTFLSQGLHLQLAEVNASTAIYPLQLAWSILFLQAVSVYSELLSDKAELTILRQKLLENSDIWLQRSPETGLALDVIVLLTCVQDQLNPQNVALRLISECLECAGRLEKTVQVVNSSSEMVAGQEVKHLEPLLGCMDALTRNYSVAKPARRQALIVSFAPLQNLMGSLSSMLQQITLQCWRKTVYIRYSIASSPLHSSVEWPMDAANKASCMIVSLSAALLQCLGKKSFGKSASDVLEVSVAFIDSCLAAAGEEKYSINLSNPSFGTIFAINPHNPLALALFDSSGMNFLEQVLELARVLAESTAASSSTVQNQIQSTYRLLAFIIPYLSDERVCAELLQPTLKTGIVSVRCYWQKAPRSLTFLHSSGVAGAVVGNGGGSGPSSAIDPANGANVRLIAQVLIQLCVGSIQSTTVSPQDALLALEGILALGEQHQIFVVSWFQNECWQSLFTPCLRVLLLRLLNMHVHAVENLFNALCLSRLRYLRLSSEQGEEEANNKVREFWFYVAQEIAHEYQAGEGIQGDILAMLNGADMIKFDGHNCLQEMVNPIAAEISRRL